jgi:hypothetical protein
MLSRSRMIRGGGPNSEDWRKSLVLSLLFALRFWPFFVKLTTAAILQLFVAARVAMGVALGGTWPAMHAITGAEPSCGHFVNKSQKSRVILRPYCESTASHVLINLYANEIFN